MCGPLDVPCRPEAAWRGAARGPPWGLDVSDCLLDVGMQSDWAARLGSARLRRPFRLSFTRRPAPLCERAGRSRAGRGANRFQVGLYRSDVPPAPTASTDSTIAHGVATWRQSECLRYMLKEGCGQVQLQRHCGLGCRFSQRASFHSAEELLRVRMHVGICVVFKFCVSVQLSFQHTFCKVLR